MSAPKPLVAGNWKMNGLKSSVKELDATIAGLTPELTAKVDVMLCPPATLLISFADRAAGTPLDVGAQNCHSNNAGAHTGDLSAEMLADAGAAACIVGHSERRADYGESDLVACGKAEAVLRAGLTAIVCVGETRAERDAGQALAIVRSQVLGSLPEESAEKLVVAYEPVWAIGTGLTPTVDDVAEVHAMIRDTLVGRYGEAGKGIRILYGGSVKPSNAAELLAIPNVDGALVGGASLKAVDLLAIAEAAPAR